MSTKAAAVETLDKPLGDNRRHDLRCQRPSQHGNQDWLALEMAERMYDGLRKAGMPEK
jgi:hypothetical protein